MPAYRTAQGKNVDMSQLVARNEKVRAVGNMNVNARGDIIDSHNRVIKDNNKRVRNNYQKGIGEKSVAPKPQVPNNSVSAPIPAVADIEELADHEKELFDDDEDIVK
jgi:hypothetical protein